MARNWLRTCTLSVSNGVTVHGGGQTDLRVVFSIEQWGGQAPNMGRFRVYNASPSTVAKLKAKETTKLTFEAGYEDHSGLVFSGDVKQTIAGHETAVDSYVDIFAADSEFTYNTARVTKTLAAGYTPQDKMQVALDSLGLKIGLTNVDLSQPKFPRGIPLFGMARDIMREVAMSAGALWSIQNGQVHVIDHRKPVGGSGPIVMNASTGMIGWPRQTADGIIVTSLLNSALQCHAKLKIDPSSIIAAEQDNNPLTGPGSLSNQDLANQALGAGTYTVFKINRHGDTRGGDWYDESWCIGDGGSLPSSQLGQNYSLGTP